MSAAHPSPIDIAREANRMGRHDQLQKLVVTCMIFAALVSAAQTVDNMIDKSWRRRIQEEREFQKMDRRRDLDR